MGIGGEAASASAAPRTMGRLLCCRPCAEASRRRRAGKLLGSAHARHKAGALAEAECFFEKVLDLDPNNAEADAHAREQQRTGLKKNSFVSQLFFFFPQPRMLEPADLGSIFARA